MKYFSPTEVEALIPKLEQIFEKIAELSAQAELKAATLRNQDENEDPAASAIEHSKLRFLATRINDWLKQIVELGGHPKGISPALVDFPSRLEGREVYLCWKLGEKKLTHYHGVDQGFSERRVLPKRKIP